MQIYTPFLHCVQLRIGKKAMKRLLEAAYVVKKSKKITQQGRDFPTFRAVDASLVRHTSGGYDVR